MRNKKEKTPRAKSIVWRIHGRQLLRTLLLFLILDAIVLGILFTIGLVDPTAPLRGLRLLTPLFLFEQAYFIFSLLFGSASLNRIMRPLTRLAETTRAISREKQDDEVLRQLENAIQAMDPQDGTLHTGNSELQGLEAAVNRLLQRMRESYARQARFVSDASHELRTPISVIQGYADMLDRWGKDDPQVLEEGISAIKSESEHMSRLVEQLLFLARGDSGRNPLKVTDFSLNDMLRETESEYEMISPDHQWQLKLPEEAIACRGDADMIKQAVRIFCDNAVKYAPADTTVTLGLRRDGSDVRLWVQDEGIGISQQDQAHVLERFYRADEARARQTGGSGLGLSIADWIIRRHGGRIEVLSREGLGSRFTAVLPIER